MITSINRASITVAAIAFLTLPAAAQSDVDLAGAFGSMRAAVAATAQLNPATLTRDERIALFAAEYHKYWPTVISMAVTQGTRTPVPNSSDFIYELKKSTVGVRLDATAYRVTVTGQPAADGSFKLTGAKFFYERRVPGDIPAMAWNVKRWHYSTDESAALTQVLWDHDIHAVDGLIDARKKSADISDNLVALTYFKAAVASFKML